MTTPARIAIVDDDPAFSQYLSVLLGSRGYDVITYRSGSDLLGALEADRAPDVVLLDVLMPGMDGLETLRMVRANHPALQVIMLSGTQVPATIVDAVRLGAVDYVVKPDDPEGLGEAALEAAIRNAVEKQALTSEVARLRAQVVDDPDGAQPCWGSGVEMRRVLTMVERVADSDVNVLITGESGVGKEVIAHELHRRSARRPRPFVKVNCAALPADLLESELFGHERGAFTGAQASRVGKFEFANGGTIMLDEIGEMPLPLQAKLLHVLQDHQFTRLGSNRAVETDVRVVAATNRDLELMIRAGTFREDLYYRLQVIELRVPPLRDRRDEIIPLVEFFLLRYAARYGRPAARPSQRLREAFLTYNWPGNVRELENVIKRFVILQDEHLVLAELQRQRPTDQTPAPAPALAEAPAAAVAAAPVAPAVVATPPMPVAPMVMEIQTDAGSPAKLPDLARRAALNAERDAIQQALDHFRWNRRKAAQQLGVSYKTLLNKMKECGISAPTE
ncbi:MAG: sigma-54-dependent Fis family transcriptional regulator [Acidobacteria bacterium]|nr:sigma-54-dependent Fis family transcriptional regulator [Acidobacteriota bacterium]